MTENDKRRSAIDTLSFIRKPGQATALRFKVRTPDGRDCSLESALKLLPDELRADMERVADDCVTFEPGQLYEIVNNAARVKMRVVADTHKPEEGMIEMICVPKHNNPLTNEIQASCLKLVASKLHDEGIIGRLEMMAFNDEIQKEFGVTPGMSAAK